MNKRLWTRLLLLAALFAVVWFVQQRRQQSVLPEKNTPTAAAPGKTANPTASEMPDYVREVLVFVQKNGQAPEGYLGGREFQNREKRLPLTGPSGQRIRYREWDVHPKVPGQNRGAERLVTGSDHSAWYTKDHYDTFIRLE